MRTFLLKVAVALLIALAVHAFAGRYADGTTDEYYLRFTEGRKSAMVLGTSRAAQGIIPSEMHPVLQQSGIDNLSFNFSFTVAHSPYGPTYLDAIKKKLNKGTTAGLFILTVDPWSLSDQRSDESADFAESDRMLGEQCLFNGMPNYEYLARHLPSGWGSLIGGPLHDPDTTSVLHEDGWLEVRIDNSDEMRRKRTSAKMNYYRKEMMPGRERSHDRIASLAATIDLLKVHGTVVLVRMPVGKELLALERELWPSFSMELEGLAEGTNTPFLDLVAESAEYEFTDGNHLTAVSAKMFSRDLAQRIVPRSN